jgi:hypothetical protein
MLSYIKRIALLAFLVGSAQATVTLQFSQGGKGATGFANSSGVVTNGMSWGIIVDTSGNGFSATAYDLFTTGANTNQILSAGGMAPEDYYVASGLQTQTIGAPFFAGVEAGSGAITSIANVPFGSISGLSIDQNDKYQIVWFETTPATSGARYGVFSDVGLVIPADGGTTSFSSVFTGADPVRTANLTIGSGGAPIPEPSRTLLTGIGAIALIARRKRDI